MQNKLLVNPHAGETLQEEFLTEFNLTSHELGIAVNLPQSIIDNIISGKLLISEDVDLRLACFLGVSEGYFLRLQNSHELMKTERELGKRSSKVT